MGLIYKTSIVEIQGGENNSPPFFTLFLSSAVSKAYNLGIIKM